MMTRILFAGIGGVGGYFGGMLANLQRNDLSVCFLTRGDNLEAINRKGLLLTTPTAQYNTRADIVSDTISDFGTVDYIILCTKSYDLEQMLDQLKPCVSRNTVFLPLLNGVDSVGKIEVKYPHNLVANGCVYIVSRRISPGHIQNFGDKQRIVFGIDQRDDPRLNFLFEAFKQAGMDTILTKKISAKVWEKFIFISATATLTSYYNKTFGELGDCTECCEDLGVLIDECCLIARQMKIDLPTDIKERIWRLFLNLPSETTTSMHSDFLAENKRTEVHSLTGYIVEQARSYGVDVPKYQAMYTALLH